MADLTTYLCPAAGATFSGLVIRDACAAPADVDAPAVFLRPAGTFGVDASLMPTVDCIDALLADLGGIALFCARGIQTNHRGEFSARNGYMTFAWTNWPEDFCGPCAWKGSTITRRNLITLSNGAFLSSSPSVPAPGFIPTDGSACHRLSRETIFNTSDPECVPGEQLRLYWYLLIGGKIEPRQVAALVFDTPAITGGRITDISGANTINRRITVNFSDWGEVELTPTDFADYTVGSWIYVLKAGRSEATEVNRQTSYELGDGFYDIAMVDELFRLTNLERTSRGLAPLVANSQLSAAAERHGNDMADLDFLSHTGSDGSTSFERVQAAGYLQGLPESGGYKTGENVGVGASSAAIMVSSWMKSTGHRANILDPQYLELGLAYTETDRGKPYFVQEFGWRSDFAQTTAIVEGYRPIPIEINHAQNLGLVTTAGWSPRQLSLVDDFEADFEVSYHEGVVVDVDYGNDTIDITIAAFGPDVFADVAVRYHCPDRADTTGGARAFHAADDVLVLNRGGHKSAPTAADLSVVGFVDDLRMCATGIALFKLWDWASSAWKYLFYSFSNGAVHPVLDTDGSSIAQPFALADVTGTLAGICDYNGLINEAAATYDTADYREDDYFGYYENPIYPYTTCVEYLVCAVNPGPDPVCCVTKRALHNGYDACKIYDSGIVLKSFKKETIDTEYAGGPNYYWAPYFCSWSGVVPPGTLEKITHYSTNRLLTLSALDWSAAAKIMEYFTYYQKSVSSILTNYDIYRYPLGDPPGTPETILSTSGPSSTPEWGTLSKLYVGGNCALLADMYHCRVFHSDTGQYSAAFDAVFKFQERAAGNKFAWSSFATGAAVTDDTLYGLFGTIKAAQEANISEDPEGSFNNFGVQVETFFY